VLKPAKEFNRGKKKEQTLAELLIQRICHPPVVVGGKVFQIEPTRWRATLAGCSVTVCEHLDQTWSIRYGPHIVGRYTAQGWPWLCESKLDRRGKTVAVHRP
jgi:hypothetical protein